tara:strand:- start:309 stop:593 length:285 start_codon:yes stop_codon:yes gene_type:complete
LEAALNHLLSEEQDSSTKADAHLKRARREADESGSHTEWSALVEAVKQHMKGQKEKLREIRKRIAKEGDLRFESIDRLLSEMHKFGIAEKRDSR